MSSWWSSITSALSTTTASTSTVERAPPPLQEVLLEPKGKGASRRERIRELRERADALQRELHAAADQTEAAEAATRHAERRAVEAAAELDAVVRTIQTHEEKLLGMEAELREKNERVRLLEAIHATLTNKK